MWSTFSDFGNSLREHERNVFDMAQEAHRGTNSNSFKLQLSMNRLEEEAQLMTSVTQRVHSIIMSIIKNI